MNVFDAVKEAEIRVPNKYALDHSELLQAQSVNPSHSPSIGVVTSHFFHK